MKTETAPGKLNRRSIGKRVTIPFKSEEHWKKTRTRDITSTESAALFGLSPYLTPYELWHRKKSGAIPEIGASERMAWGTRLQDAIAGGIAADNNWIIRKRTQYERIPSRKIGASYDYTIIERPGGNALLEIKNVDALALKNGWIVGDDSLEAPPHIEMQVQHQMLVSGFSRAVIGALVGGNRAMLIEREASPEIHAKILDGVDAFWLSIAEDKPPEPDFQRDAAFIAEIHSSAQKGEVYDASKDAEIADLMRRDREAKDAIDAATATRAEIKAKILTKIGTAAKVVGETFTIATGEAGDRQIAAHVRKGYRNFRVNHKNL